jgi:3-methyladenine DNA glycosylase AlkD
VWCCLVSVEEVLRLLESKSRRDQLAGMARYGMNVEKRLGVSIPELRKMAKFIGKDHELARGLWKTGFADARILAAMVDDSDLLDEQQMEQWVKDIDSWDVGDQVCMNLFEKSPLAWKKVDDWSMRSEEFVKRTAFGLLACLAWHDKKAGDEKFIRLFHVFARGAVDERSSVKKAVSWALRNVGKRNLKLNKAATDEAKKIRMLNSKSTRWIAADVVRELESEAVQKRLERKQS